MPSFGKHSRENLETCDYRLIKLFNEVVDIADCSVLCGHRNEEDQNKAFDEGHSKLRWPRSQHNIYPSTGIDVVPYPIDWEDLEPFFYLAGVVKGVAKMMSYIIEWGGDWTSFKDYPHYQLVVKE